MGGVQVDQSDWVINFGLLGGRVTLDRVADMSRLGERMHHAPFRPDLARGTELSPDRTAKIIITAVSLLVAANLILRFAEPSSASLLLWIDLVAGGVGCLMLAVLPRWPLTASVLLIAAAAASPAATLPVAAATWTVARRYRTTFAAAFAAMAAAAAIQRNLWQPIVGLTFTWWIVLVVAMHAAIAAIGVTMQARHALVASLEERAIRAERDQLARITEARRSERAQIAREMHDVLAHRLSLLATYAGAFTFRPDVSTQQLEHAAGIIRLSAHQALEELRDVIGVLRDDDEPGLAAERRPQPTLADVPGLVEESRQAGASVHLDNRITRATDAAEQIGRTAYRVLQEALTNARKHAPGQPIRVLLAGGRGTALTIEVRNQLTSGSLTSPGVPGSGLGLIGLAERVQLAGGHLRHGETASREFLLTASIPWPP